MLSSSSPRLAAAASSHSVSASLHGDIGTPVAENWCYTQVCFETLIVFVTELSKKKFFYLVQLALLICKVRNFTCT